MASRQPLKRRRRILVGGAVFLLLAAAATVSVLVVTRQSGGSSPRAVAAVQRYDGAIDRNDPAGACAALAPQAQVAMAKAASPFGNFTCPQLMQRFLTQLGPGGRAAIGSAPVRILSATQNTARAEVSFGGDRKPAELFVLRFGDRWLVGSPVAASGR